MEIYLILAVLWTCFAVRCQIHYYGLSWWRIPTVIVLNFFLFPVCFILALKKELRHSTFSDGKNVMCESWSFGPFLIEKHHVGVCTCSYCREGKVGLVLPAIRKNGWKSIRWHWKKSYWVVRWVNLFRWRM